MQGKNPFYHHLYWKIYSCMWAAVLLEYNKHISIKSYFKKIKSNHDKNNTEWRHIRFTCGSVLINTLNGTCSIHVNDKCQLSPCAWEPMIIMNPPVINISLCLLHHMCGSGPSLKRHQRVESPAVTQTQNRPCNVGSIISGVQSDASL